MNFRVQNYPNEHLDKIICKLNSPFIDSNHDAILSSCALPAVTDTSPTDSNTVAPRIPNNRVKIVWNEEGVDEYENFLTYHK